MLQYGIYLLNEENHCDAAIKGDLLSFIHKDAVQ